MNTGTEYFLGDALGSVRQLTDASGDITLAKQYDPYGSVAQSVGSGESIYAYTGEQTDISGMTYLRARYYSSGTGRFLTRDTWMGEYNRPLSLNRWGYVEGNPVNFTDPSGYSPVCDNGDWDRCGIPDWWKRRSHLYVEGFGYFETGHLQRGWGSAKWIEESIDALVGGGEIHLSSKEGQPPKEVYWVDYYVTANIKTLDKAQKTSVMYGIYTDFERGYETYQNLKWNRFPSAFSPEDLPSDHLGFWAYTHGLTEDDIPFLLECLGEVTDRGSDQFASVVVDYVSGPYGRASWYPRNYKFQPMITESYSFSYGGSESISGNISWPMWLQIQPILSGPNTWWRVREGYIWK